MGPVASAHFLQCIIARSRVAHGARRNHEFPHILLSSLPVPDLVRSVDRELEESIVHTVEREAAALARAGADLLVLTCHTMHLFLPRLSAAAGRPILSMLDVAIAALTADRRRRVGLLATDTTVERGLYMRPLARAGCEVVIPAPAEQHALAEVIERAISGAPQPGDRAVVTEVGATLVGRGADSLLLACTELSLLGIEAEALPFYDSLVLLARAACARAYA
jgi:aspartate racemase